MLALKEKLKPTAVHFAVFIRF